MTTGVSSKPRSTESDIQCMALLLSGCSDSVTPTEIQERDPQPQGKVSRDHLSRSGLHLGQGALSWAGVVKPGTWGSLGAEAAG